MRVLHETLNDTTLTEDPLPLQNFSITPTEGRFVKFELLTFYGKGGGLQYFAGLSGFSEHFYVK